MHPRPSGLVTLCTDFGTADPYVGIMKGALLKHAAKVRSVDLTHAVAPQDVAGGAFHLWSAIDRFPSGTVHVGVVDPGVGTERRLLAISAHDAYWLVPDNGLAGAVLAGCERAEVRAIDFEHLRLRAQSATFHGRDLLAPAAAALATGRYGFTALGPVIHDHDATDPVFGGEARIVHVDRYGNLISNVRQADGVQQVRLGEHAVAMQRTYGDVEDGELLAYVGSFGLLEIAARNASAAVATGLQVGAPIEAIAP